MITKVKLISTDLILNKNSDKSKIKVNKKIDKERKKADFSGLIFCVTLYGLSIS